MYIVQLWLSQDNKMADLNNLQAAQTVKLAGSDSSGVETTFISSTLNGEIKSADILNVTVLQTTLIVNQSAAPVEVKVGASPLVNRKSVLIQAQGSNVIYGFSSTVHPFTLANGSTITLAVGDGVRVWVDRSSVGNVNVAIAEFA